MDEGVEFPPSNFWVLIEDMVFLRKRSDSTMHVGLVAPEIPPTPPGSPLEDHFFILRPPLFFCLGTLNKLFPVTKFPATLPNRRPPPNASGLFLVEHLSRVSPLHKL